jgi:outer membrane protein assembly factor BamB
MHTVLRFILFVSASAVFADWPTYHGRPDLRGVAEAEIPEAPEMLWRYNAGAEILHTPVSDGERIFFTARGGLLFAVDLNGSLLWKKSFTRMNDAGQPMAVRFDGPPACGGGRVIAGTTRGTVFALEAATGEEAWRYETGGILIGSPNFIPGRMSVAGDDARAQRKEKPEGVVVLDQASGTVYALELRTGTLKWKTAGVERCDGSPGVGGGRIVFGSCAAALHLYSAADGAHLQDLETGSEIAGGTSVDGNLAFAGTRDGRLICADLEAGEILWSSRQSASQTFSTPAVTDHQGVYSADNGFVYAVDRSSGDLLWSFETGGLPGSPVVSKDKVIVTADGILHLLDLKNGRKIWAKEISDEITSPAVIRGMIVIGAGDGTVSAFGKKE